MILVRLMGGLGNQMFQYACGRALAWRTGHALVLDPSHLATRHPTAPRRFSLDAFPIAARLATPADTAEAQSLPALLWRRFGRPLASDLTMACEHGLRFQPDLFPARFQRLCLVGYWQTEKYFSDCADLIRRDFAPRTAPDPALAARLAAAPSVALHIRRGDYAADATINSVHGLCPLDYYHRAAAHLAERVGRPQFFLFSDDPDWARAHLQLEHPLHVISDGRRAPAEELALMTCCRHHITANSSFSWWGAWLNPRPDKLICAPRAWFRDPALDATDLVPATWLRL